MSAIVNEELRFKEENLPLGSRRRVAEWLNSVGNVTGGNTAQILIPSLRNGFLDTSGATLTFTVQTALVGTVLPFNTTGTQTNTDEVRLSASGGVSFIKTIRLYSNNTIVSTVTDCNKIASIIQVANTSIDSLDSGSVLAGVSDTADGGLIGIDFANTFGHMVDGGTALASTTPKMTFTINAGILSFLGDGIFLPINAIPRGIRMEIDFESEARLSYVAFDGSTITSGINTFSNIKYSCPVIELDDSSMNAVNQENGFGQKDVMWSSVNHRLSRVNWKIAEITAGGVSNLLVPAIRYTSLKSIVLGAFDTFGATSINVTDFNIPKISWNSLQYRMLGQDYPLQKMDTLAKMVQNTIACYSNISNSVGSTLMTATGKGGVNEGTELNYKQLATLASDYTYYPRGVCGINLESWAESDAISGLDVSHSDCEVLIGSDGVAPTFNSDLCFLSTFDTIYIINSQGVLSSSFVGGN